MNTPYVPGCYLLQQMSSHVTLFFNKMIRKFYQNYLNQITSNLTTFLSLAVPIFRDFFVLNPPDILVFYET